MTPSSVSLSFNPCFCGTRPRSNFKVVIPFAKRMFQSLFLWNSPSEGNFRSILVCEEKFQSLFLWNSPSENTMLTSTTGCMMSFNPCFCGTRPRSPCGRGNFRSILGFNPCFCGTRPRRIGMDAATIQHRCFNPCFCGTRPRRGSGQPNRKP